MKMKIFVGALALLFLSVGVPVAQAQQVPCFKEQGGAAWVAGTGCIFDGAGIADVFVLDADNDTTISAPSDDTIDIEIGGADDFRFTANKFDVLSGSTLEITGTLSVSGTTVSATAAELDEYSIVVELDLLCTASSAWVVAPHAGDVVKIYTVIDGLITGGDAVLDPQIATVSITNGGITIANSGSAAGDVDSSTPTAANTVTAGQAIEIATDGGCTGTPQTEISIVISR